MKKYFGTIELDGELASWVEIEAGTDRQASQKTLMHFYDLGMVSLGEPTQISICPEHLNGIVWTNYKGKVMTEVEFLD
jgi:hypothetical protein